MDKLDYLKKNVAEEGITAENTSMLVEGLKDDNKPFSAYYVSLMALKIDYLQSELEMQKEKPS
tara:strand:+ start:3636 stop:3824 length:189 start_codon:yes stop_codon:yes gene_type:complete